MFVYARESDEMLALSSQCPVLEILPGMIYI